MKTTTINSKPTHKDLSSCNAVPAVSADEFLQTNASNSLGNSLEQLPGGFIILDKRGRVRQHNKEAEKILGLKIQDMLWVDILGQRVDPNSRGLIQLNNGPIVNLATKPFNDGQGQVILLTEVTASINYQSNAEQQHRLSAMGEMLAKLAHQIRTPLSSALIMTSQLSKSSTPPDIAEKFVHKTHACLRNLNKLVNEMLCFTQGSAPVLSHFSVTQLLKDLGDNLQHLEGAERQIKIVPPRLHIELLANRSAIMASLENIVINAWQATSDSDREIIITAVHHQDMVNIIVSDNGPGIPLTVRQRIFEPFFTTKKQGSGLGLAVVQAAMEAHGGAIQVDNFAGGCDAILQLPIKHREDENVRVVLQ